MTCEHARAPGNSLTQIFAEIQFIENRCWIHKISRSVYYKFLSSSWLETSDPWIYRTCGYMLIPIVSIQYTWCVCVMLFVTVTCRRWTFSVSAGVWQNNSMDHWDLIRCCCWCTPLRYSIGVSLYSLYSCGGYPGFPIQSVWGSEVFGGINTAQVQDCHWHLPGPECNSLVGPPVCHMLAASSCTVGR